jgi:hypothetical protein
MEKLLHGETKSNKNSIWEGKIITFGTYTEVLKYFENGNIKKYKNGNIFENGNMKWKNLMSI